MAAPVTTSRLLSEDSQHARYLFTASFTDTQETTVTKVDTSALALAISTTGKISVKCAEWNCTPAGVVNVKLGSTTVLLLNGEGEAEGELSATGAANDDITFTTTGFTSGGGYQVFLTVRKCEGFAVNPILTSVEIPTGDYETGDEVTATATFGALVNVSNAVLAMDVNGTARSLVAIPNQSSVTPAFKYTVKAADHAELTQVTLGTMSGKAGPYSIYGGSPAGPASLASYTSDVTDVSFNAAATVDTVELTDGVGNAYETGDVVEVTVTFDKTVAVTGTPRVQLLITSGNKYATFVGYGADQTELLFHYTVVAGDVALATGFDISTTALGLNSGTITNAKAPTVNAVLTLPATNTAAVTVN